MGKYIGNRSFYSRVLKLAIPIMIQSGITNFVNMLDNVMVGKIGTIEMTGVAITNQLIFVFNLCIFGAVSGAGIFGAQYFGKKDVDGLRYTFRFKLISSVVLSVLGILIFIFGGKALISLYLQSDDSVTQLDATMGYAWDYLKIILIGLIPYGIAQGYASSLRECDNSMPPMVAGGVAVLVNLALNWVLIFGHLGFAPMGVKGAAIATVISRFVELAIISIWTFAIRGKMQFIVGAFRSLYVPGSLVKQIFIKGMPLMVNETLWSAGKAALSQCYSTRSLDAVAAFNIAATFYDVFAVVFLSMGSAIGIIIGQLLGNEEFDNARDNARKLITFSVFTGVICGGLFFLCAAFIPEIYNTEDSVKLLATEFMRIWAILMPAEAFVNGAYFTIRSGGKVLVTILFDCCFMWGVMWSVAFVIANFTSLGIIPLFAIAEGLAVLKAVLGYIFVKKGIWVRKIV